MMSKYEGTGRREALSDGSMKKEENKTEKRGGQEEEGNGQARVKGRSWAALQNIY
jgi:hypothetical protein